MPAERIVVDANVLVYALYQDAPQHAASRAFLDRARGADLAFCLTSQTLAEFYSIVTSPKRVSAPRTPREALGAIQSLLALPGTTVLPMPADVTSRWMGLLNQHPVRGGAIFDLQLIATMMANGVGQICTFNRQDFEGFPGIEVLTP